MRLLAHATTLALLAAPAAGYAPAVAARSALLRPAGRLPRHAACAPAMLDADARRQPLAAVPAVKAAAPRLLSTASRFALALLTSLLGVLVRVVPAVAVSTARRASSSAFPVGEVVKYGGVIGLIGAAYAFRREEVPILTETPMGENDEPASSAAASAFAATDDAAPSAAPSLDSLDDSSINSLLLQRMQQLSEEAEAPPEEATPPPADSADGWGTGDTAVLERPSADDATPTPGGLLDGEPAVDFPTGFPLVDAEWESEPAVASDDQVAMLNRMFGNAAE